MKNNVVSFASAAMAARLSGFLQAHGRSNQVLSSATSKFDDLQRGPTVLLGGLNNAWTLRLTDALRFSFDRSHSTCGFVIASGRNKAGPSI
jgi:hypothetical protein